MAGIVPTNQHTNTAISPTKAAEIRSRGNNEEQKRRDPAIAGLLNGAELIAFPDDADKWSKIDRTYPDSGWLKALGRVLDDLFHKKTVEVPGRSNGTNEVATPHVNEQL